MPGQTGQRPVQRLDPRGVIEPAGHVLGEVRDLPATASRASAARYLRAARRWPRATLVAIPSSQGLSEPPSGAILSRLRQASRNVIAITSSAADQSPVSRKAWLYTDLAHASKTAPNASASPARARARNCGVGSFTSVSWPALPPGSRDPHHILGAQGAPRRLGRQARPSRSLPPACPRSTGVTLETEMFEWRRTRSRQANLAHGMRQMRAFSVPGGPT